jgi:hypothetical protein
VEIAILREALHLIGRDVQMFRSFVRREQSVIALRLRHRLRRAADNQIEGCEVINGHRLKLPLVTTRQSGTGISALFHYSPMKSTFTPPPSGCH